jgi:hypothetical protein
MLVKPGGAAVVVVVVVVVKIPCLLQPSTGSVMMLYPWLMLRFRTGSSIW